MDTHIRPEIREIAALLIKRINEELSPAEETRLQHWMGQSDAHREAAEGFMNEGVIAKNLGGLLERKAKVWAMLDEHLHLHPIRVHRFNWKKIAVAASIILAIGTGYFLFSPRPPKGGDKVAETTNDVEAPKTAKATITLSDGRTVSIDSLTTLTQNNVSVIKTADGKIIYTGTANEVVYNTLNNPKGSKVIDMTLADGSHVWLNAGSSVRYPIAFTGDERKVEITGEAYLEVTPNSSMPFTVSTGDVKVQVLGTKFNVNAYDDEPNIKVTLLEGSVNVRKGSSLELMKPGQQAQIAESIKMENNVDMEAVMAWKNGLFNFNRADMKAVMRQISRWYDAEIVYTGPVPSKQFGGDIQRDLPLSSVLRNLEKYGVKFKVKGRTITVSQ